MTPPTIRPEVAFPSLKFVGGRLGLVFPWLLVFLLALSNLGVLMNQRVHAVAYDFLASAIQLGGESLAQRLLSRSPTAVRGKAVERATQTLRAHTAELEAQHKLLAADHARLKASHAALAEEHETLRATSLRRAASVRGVAARTTAKLAARSAEAVTTLPGRAVPYVGIVALVGFTVYEVKTDCEVARSLADLSLDYGNDEPIDTGTVCGYVQTVPTPGEAWNRVVEQANARLRGLYLFLQHSSLAVT